MLPLPPLLLIGDDPGVLFETLEFFS